MAAGPRLGIDFGTSHTVALLAWPDGRVRPLLFDGSPLLPSAVYAQTDGALLVGRDAVHAARVDPARFEGSPKRRIDDGTVLLGDRELSVPSLIGAVLGHVNQEAVRVAGGPVAELTLTHPAAWGVSRRLALIEGAKLAGLPQPALMPEPVAAAHYFAGVLQKPLAGDQGLLVYDFGGGTFDASLVSRSGEGFDVRAVDGIDDLGGLDLDALIVEHARGQIENPEVWARLDNPQSTEDRRHRRMLWDDARIAKEMLSRTPSAALHVPIAAADVTITREQFEDKARGLLEQTVRTTGAVMRWAGMDKSKLAGLFLVGGSSRVPLVNTLLQRELGLAPTVIEQPELVVAEGSLRAWVNIARPAQNASNAAFVPSEPPSSAAGSPAAASSAAGPTAAAGAAAAAAGMANAAGAAAAPGAAAAAGQQAPMWPQQATQAAQQPGQQAGQPMPQPGQQQVQQPGQFAQPQPPVSSAPVSSSPVSSSPMSSAPVSSTPASSAPVSPAAFQQPQYPQHQQPGYQQPQYPASSAPVSPAAFQHPAPVSGAPVSPAAFQQQHPAAYPTVPQHQQPHPGPDAQATQRLRPMTPAPQVPPPQAYVSPAAQPTIYAPPPREEAPPPPSQGRNWAVPLLIGILVLVLGLAGYVVFQNRDNKGNEAAGDTGTSAPAADASGDGVRAIPQYNREDEPSWVPNGWRDQGFGAVDQLWKSQQESEGGRCDTGNGRLRVTTDQAPGLTGCTLKPPLDVPMTDGSIETKVKLTAGCAGLWLRTGEHGYTLGLCDDNKVRLYKLYKDPPNEHDLIKEWPYKPGNGVQDMFVAFKIEGNQLNAYVNGVQFGPVADDEIHTGKVNLGAFTLTGKTADASYTQVRVFMPEDWQPGNGPTTTQTRRPQPSTSSSGWNSKSPSAAPTTKKPTPQPTA
ncbi:Hsp70 family protein [Dactylosporangium sp. CS-047395]|uniref:Hsp70 family protein n=1 Tax=Dactylosporangium sp. CS-047395 TaxID=3239936 RepID=UPI003D8BFED5